MAEEQSHLQQKTTADQPQRRPVLVHQNEAGPNYLEIVNTSRENTPFGLELANAYDTLAQVHKGLSPFNEITSVLLDIKDQISETIQQFDDFV